MAYNHTADKTNSTASGANGSTAKSVVDKVLSALSGTANAAGVEEEEERTPEEEAREEAQIQSGLRTKAVNELIARIRFFKPDFNYDRVTLPNQGGYTDQDLTNLEGELSARMWAARKPQDRNVDPAAPNALPTNRPIGTSQTQNAAAQRLVNSLRAQGYTDIRVNQQQVDANGVRVGINRPDVQATSPGGKRVYFELDRSTSARGPAHQARTTANDPAGKSILKTED